MNKEQFLLLDKYIKLNYNPILIENIPAAAINNAVFLKADCDITLLNGHYENENFVAPKWFNELISKETPILVIDNINSISLEEQTKFVEILKYKKISTFNLPNNCLIILTASYLKNNPINEIVYSLVVHIKDK